MLTVNLASLFRSKAREEDRVLVVNGHPDPRPERFCAALCSSYAGGARSRGCQTRRLDVGRLAHSAGEVEGSLDLCFGGQFAHALERISWADRVFVAFPMWLGKPPVALGLLFEAFSQQSTGEFSSQGLANASERKKTCAIVTTSLPALVYRSRNGSGDPIAEWTRSLSGLDVVQTTIIGAVDSISSDERFRWLNQMHRLGSGCQ